MSRGGAAMTRRACATGQGGVNPPCNGGLLWCAGDRSGSWKSLKTLKTFRYVSILNKSDLTINKTYQ